MKKLFSSLLCFLLLSLTVIPFAFAADTGSSAPVKSVNDFKDLKDQPQELKDKLDELIREGVFSGLTDDTFGLDAQMDRAQFAKVATIIFALPMDKTLTKSSFNDVSSDHWALTYVEALKKAGLTNGYDAEGKTYNPSGPVSRQELAAFLIRGLGLDDAVKSVTPVSDSSVDGWAQGYVALALDKKLLTNLDSGKFDGSAPATRKMLALASYEAKMLFNDKGTTAPTTPTTPTSPTTPVTPTEPATTPQPDTKPAEPDAKPDKVSVKGKKVIITSDMQGVKLRTDEEAIVNRMQSLGFEVTRLSSTKLTVDAVQGFDLIVIGSSTNSKYVKKKLKDVPIPIVYNKSISFGDADFSTVSEGTSVQKQTASTIKAEDHPLAAGLKGDVDFYYEPAPVSFGIPSSDGIVIASLKSDPSKAIVIGYEKGSKNILGEAVVARTVMYGPDASQMKDNGTDEAWKLFDASCLWAVGAL
ncbi:Cellulosome-anchoring protein precursor [Paenibacillus konkukensis]|uniref:Cellulosome-anchoring protein n=1 Tax=Paenibacillus konkukensis TaxID=2020716 RepID=A0ABY4RH82_9BACL|nr:S-layer homology domain-containing protein [Paenibacillus konkukensis]UQZ81796.1 Cellulosome-anchoring protein precursor [Paenibacillus konkukensis]